MADFLSSVVEFQSFMVDFLSFVSEREHELVALIPMNDKRLHPRRTYVHLHLHRTNMHTDTYRLVY